MESGQVPEKGSGKYRERVESGRVPKKGSGKYRERVVITTKKCYFVDLIIMVLSTFE